MSVIKLTLWVGQTVSVLSAISHEIWNGLAYKKIKLIWSKKIKLAPAPNHIKKFRIGATFEMRTTLCKICLLNDQDGNAQQG